MNKLDALRFQLEQALFAGAIHEAEELRRLYLKEKYNERKREDSAKETK